MPRAPLPETRRAATEPGGLTVRTVPIADPGDLLAGLPEAPLLSWVRRGRGLVGWGEAARITLSAGEDRFTAGEKRLRTLFESVDLRGPGTGTRHGTGGVRQLHLRPGLGRIGADRAAGDRGPGRRRHRPG